MQLRHARFVHAELGANLFHRDFAVVVERDHAALAHRQGFDRAAHALTHFGALVRQIGTLGLGRHQDGGQLRLVQVIAAQQRRGRLDGLDANDGLAQALLVGADRFREVRE